jgi:acetolactate synthase-1/2/3 large subunit
MTRSGGRILVDQLELHGVDLAFGVPGESYLAILDALYDSSIRYVTCRHEGGAANMADAYGKLTGRPGICMVTRGPGATHASSGIHTAYQDSTPLLLIVGQVARTMKGREAFQEIDYRQMFAPMAKWVDEVDRLDRIPELVARAFHTATSGRPGPVVLAFPEDLLAEEGEVEDAARFVETQARPSDADLARVREILQSATRPFMVAGGAPWSNAAGEALRGFCETNELPVAASFRCQDYVDNESTVYAGHLTLGLDHKLAARVRDADVLLVVGARLGEITTLGYSLIQAPSPHQRLIHVHADPNELGRVYTPELGVASSPEAFALALAGVEPLDTGAWSGTAAQAHEELMAFMQPTAQPGDLDLGEVITHVREHVPRDTIVTNGAGNFTVWAHRFWEFHTFRSQLAPTSGAMGYGVPAAVAAKLVHPERVVLAFAGDGDFLMAAQELATAAQYETPIIVLVVDNGMYGTIRMHQERHYPGRVSGTDLKNPDFAALAASFGAFGERVEQTVDFPAAFERALASGRTAVLQLVVDPESITPRQTLSEIRAAAEART